MPAGQPSQGGSTQAMVDLFGIDRRLETLLSNQSAQQYQRKKCALETEFISFLSHVDALPGWDQVSPRDMCRFLIWKDCKGKTPIHSPSCSAVSSQGQCACPKRLALGTVSSTVGQLRAIFCTSMALRKPGKQGWGTQQHHGW